MNGDFCHGHPYDWAWPLASTSDAGERGYGTAYGAYSADLLASMSQALENQAESQGNFVNAQFYAAKGGFFNTLAASFRSGYTYSGNGLISYDVNGNITRIGTNCQADCVTALYFNMVPPNQRSNIICNIWLGEVTTNGTFGISNYNRYCTGASICTNHISTGNQFAARDLLELSRNGYTAVAYQVLTNMQFPSWLYWVSNGATTCWERWDSYLSGSGSDRGYYQSYNLFNSLPFAAVGEWVWAVVAGINPDMANPGFRNAIICPQPGGGINWCSDSFYTIHGPIACTWTNTGGTYTLTLTNPANTTATVFLPTTNNVAGILESGRSAAGAPGVLSYYFTNWPSWNNGATVFQVGSGGYNFTVTNVNC